MKKAIMSLVVSLGALACLGGVSSKVVACWGDSVTEGMAMPRDKTYPARLQDRLGSGYKVLNSGCGGENSVTIPVRQGAYRLATAAEISFKAGEDKVMIGDGNDNGFRTPDGSKIKLTSALGREIPVNDVVIGKDSFRLSFTEFRWNTATNPIMYKLWLSRKDSAKALAIPAGTPVKFASTDVSKRAACEIVFMGANGGWNNDIEVLIGNHRAMLERRGKGRPYLVIVPYWGGFRKDFADAFKAAFGKNAIDFRGEAIKRGLAFEGLRPTELDRREMAAGRVPPSLLYRNRPDVHMNEYGYDFLAQLVYERGKELGYWK